MNLFYQTDKTKTALLAYYPPTKSEGYSLGVVCAGVCPSVRLSARPHFFHSEPYLSTYWQDLMHSWYK